ncbi:Alpha/Beta hydrolase protein [Mycena amicta]|nr:Alpha/Beta hydrolase protein [Mycena amicta]
MSTPPPEPKLNDVDIHVARKPRCHLTYVLFLLPPLFLGLYFALLTAPPPIPPLPLPVHPGLDGLPEGIRVGVQRVYPETWLEDGGWAVFPFGRTRYWLTGPEDGLKVVLIHGLSVPALIYAPLLPHLLASNTTRLRILTYDLPGRGYSSSLPEMDGHVHDTALYTTHLALLLQHVGWSSAHSVVGISMGGAIAAAFSSAFPNLVERNLVLIASAGLLETHDLPRTAKLVASPIIQKLLTGIAMPIYERFKSSYSSRDGGDSELVALGEFDFDFMTLLRESVDPKPLNALVRVQAAHLKGFNAAISSCLRVGPVRGMGWAFERLGGRKRRVLIIHGTADHTVPPHHAQRIAELIRRGSANAAQAQSNSSSSQSQSQSTSTPSPSPWLRALPLPFLRASASASSSSVTGSDEEDLVQVVMIPDATSALTWTHAGVVGRLVSGWVV